MYTYIIRHERRGRKRRRDKKKWMYVRVSVYVCVYGSAGTLWRTQLLVKHTSAGCHTHKRAASGALKKKKKKDCAAHIDAPWSCFFFFFRSRRREEKKKKEWAYQVSIRLCSLAGRPVVNAKLIPHDIGYFICPRAAVSELSCGTRFLFSSSKIELAHFLLIYDSVCFIFVTLFVSLICFHCQLLS